MKWPFPRNKRITGKYDEQRPLSNPGEHIHGAIDVAGNVGDEVVAPEDGELIHYFAVRHDKKSQWSDSRMGKWPFRDYFYDVWGAIAVLIGESGRVHLFAHAYMNQLFNDLFSSHHWGYVEESADKRFPIFSFTMGELRVEQGQTIAKIGNAGYSTGAHCHYEIHEKGEWTRWEDRENPEDIEWRQG